MTEQGSNALQSTRLRHMEGVAFWLVKARWILALVSLLAIALAASGISKLRMEEDIRAFLNPDDPLLTRLDALHKEFQQRDMVAFALAPADGRVFTRENLAVLAQATQEAAKLPYVKRVESLTNHARMSPETYQFEPLVADAHRLSESELRDVEAYARANPATNNRLVTRGGDTSAVLMIVDLPQVVDAQRTFVAAGHALKQRLMTQHPDLKVYFFGERVSRQAVADLNVSDISVLVPTAVVLMFILIGFFLRSLSAVLCVIAVVVVSVVTTLGTFGWLGYALNANSQAAPQLLVLLATAYGTHLLSVYLRELRAGSEKLAAMRHSLSVSLAPLILCSLTEAVGFASVNFSSDPSLQDFGTIVAAGVVIAMVLAATLLPALALLFRPARARSMPWLAGTIDRLTASVLSGNRGLFWAMIAVIVVCAGLLSRNEIDQSFDEFFTERLEHRRTTDFLQEKFGAARTIHYLLDADSRGGALDPQFMAEADALAGWYRQQPGVLFVYSHVDLLKNVNRVLNGNDPRHETLPPSQQIAAKYLFVYRLSSPDASAVRQVINADRSAAQMIVGLRKMTNQELLRIEDAADRWTTSNAPRLRASASGYDLLFAHHTTRVAGELAIAALMTLGVVTLVLVIGLRSLRYALVSLVPTLLPPVVVFGIWGLLMGKLNPNTMTLLSISIGLLVDDTIHLMRYYVENRRSGYAPEQAVAQALHIVGTPIIVKSLSLALGVLVLLLSNWVPVQHIALLLTPMIVVGLVMELYLLPVILLMLDRHNAPVASAGPEQAGNPVTSPVL